MLEEKEEEHSLGHVTHGTVAYYTFCGNEIIRLKKQHQADPPLAKDMGVLAGGTKEAAWKLFAATVT